MEEESFVAVELSASASQIRDNAGYKLPFEEIYTLGGKTMWETEVEEKRCGPIAAPSHQKRSRMFYSGENVSRSSGSKLRRPNSAIRVGVTGAQRS